MLMTDSITAFQTLFNRTRLRLSKLKTFKKSRKRDPHDAFSVLRETNWVWKCYGDELLLPRATAQNAGGLYANGAPTGRSGKLNAHESHEVHAARDRCSARFPRGETRTQDTPRHNCSKALNIAAKPKRWARFAKRRHSTGSYPCLPFTFFSAFFNANRYAAKNPPAIRARVGTRARSCDREPLARSLAVRGRLPRKICQRVRSRRAHRAEALATSRAEGPLATVQKLRTVAGSSERPLTARTLSP